MPTVVYIQVRFISQNRDKRNAKKEGGGERYDSNRNPYGHSVIHLVALGVVNPDTYKMYAGTDVTHEDHICCTDVSWDSAGYH